jgi:hypothetical protein
MKLKVWSKKQAAKDNDKNQLYLRLQAPRNDEDTDIVVIVVDHKGDKINDGNLLLIDQKLKCIFTRAGINEKIPLKTDFEGNPLIYPDYVREISSGGRGIKIPLGAMISGERSASEGLGLLKKILLDISKKS